MKNVRRYSFLLEEKIARISTKRKIAYCLIIIVVGFGLGTLLFWLINGQSFTSKDTGSDDMKKCRAVPDAEKFDCHPDRPISEKECVKRGCCYIQSSDLKILDYDLINSSYLGIPSCFFPSGYEGYSVSSISRTENGIEADLERDFASGFPEDVESLLLEAKYIDDHSLRIQIKDAKNQRFEPEVQTYFKVKEKKKPLYTAELHADGRLTVTRNTSGTVLFKTELSRLVYSDQFLQLSTYVSSKYLYGLGEHKEGILKSFNWTRLTLFNQGDLPVPNRNLYGSHPFYLVLEPDGSANGLFLLNSNAMDAVLQPAPAVTLRPIGGIFDIFLLLGPSPEDVIRQYTNIVGRTFMPPYWSLGFHLCRYGYFTLNKTKETFQRNLDKGIPIDVLWNDIDYMQRYLDFTYNQQNFSGLPEFVNKLHEDGRHYVAMISPGVSNSEPPDSYHPYDDGEKLDLFVKNIDGNYSEAKVWNTKLTVFPDFSNPDTAPYWAKQFEKFHSELDFDGVWIDMNEPLNFMNGSKNGCPNTTLDNPPYLPGRPYPLYTLTICMSSRHNFTSHYNEHNLVAFREAKATYDAIKEIRKKRPFIISRASFSGQGNHSGHWSGDITSNWEDMRYTIPSMLIFNMYGMSMIGSDICGFRLNTTLELCTRWHALGAFYPFSRNHNDYDTIEQDPAALGSQVVEVTKNTLSTRYYLLPYLYTLFYRSHIFGETVVRPLFFEFSKDVQTYSIEDQFLWGPAFLIIPALYPGMKTVDAYFPKGLWYDFYSGKAFNSKGQKFTLNADLNSINLVVRGGYILPLQIPGKTTTESRKNDFELLVALDENSTAAGELYWDDGDSLDTYERKAYNLISMRVEKNTLKTSIVKGYDTEMKLRHIKIYGVTKKPSTTTINGKQIPSNYNETCLSLDASSYTLMEELTVVWK